MPRLLFEKTGNAVWMSHLDLMRLFQRGFKRAGLNLKHTQGFNPRPSVSIALPLSVGAESRCELLDFELDGQNVSCEEICSRLNHALVAGVRVRQVYETGRKIRDLALLDCRIALEYDSGVPAGAAAQLQELFGRESLMVEKKSKSGMVQQDIIPMICSMTVAPENENILTIRCRICCQNPTLNPAQIINAVEHYLPECKPDHARYCREEIYDTKENIFR